MTKFFVFILSVFCLVAAPAFAGEVSVANGQTVWKSTTCVAPVLPPVLDGVSAEAQASDVNTRVLRYNDYTQLVQAYMDCMSTEAQADAALSSSNIIKAAQASIEDVRQRANMLGASLKK